MKKIFTKYLVVLISVFLGILFIMPSPIMALSAWPPASTNALNQAQQTPGHIGQLTPYVNLIESGVGYVTLDFVGSYVGGNYFEYRVDGVLVTSGTAHVIIAGEFEYPGVWVPNITVNVINHVTKTINATNKVEVRLALGAENDWYFDWVTFNVLPQPATPAVYTITATAEGSGSITPPDTFNISAGAGQIYTMTPGDGNTISDVLVNGVSVGAVSSYTFLDVNSNQTIHAVFAGVPAPAAEIEVAGITTEEITVAGITEEATPVTISELPRTGQNILFGIFGLGLLFAGIMLAVICNKRKVQQ